MALVDTTWYCNAGNESTTGHYAVAKRPQNTAVVAGQLCRQFTAPAVNSERVFVCIVAGTTANVADATWVLTRGAKTTDGTATWMEVTGQASLNGDLTNTATWAQVKAATPAVLGQIIKRSNNASYQICTTAGAMSASEPTFSDTAGVTTTDTTAVWTSLGVVGNFTGGQALFARLASACASTWSAAGNTVYVGANHAESQATAISITNVGNNNTGAMFRIICHNQSGSYPPTSSDFRTGATVTATGNVTLTLTVVTALYVYGLIFKSGNASTGSPYIKLDSGANQAWAYYDNCSFQIAGTGANSTIQIGPTSAFNGVIILNNCTVSFAVASQSIYFGNVAQFIWQNTGQVLASGSAVPNNFIFGATAWVGQSLVFEALDFSQLTVPLLSFPAVNSGMMYGSLLVKDCKLNVATTFAQPTGSGFTVQLVRSDSGSTAYKSARYQYEGTETTETTITRVGGATDPAGQLQSRKIVTTANVQWLRPFRAEPYAIWNAVTGSNVTVTVCGTVNAGALPNNDDIWLEVEYLGSSATPLGTIVTTTKANVLATPAAVAADASSWSVPGAMLDGAKTGTIVLSNGNLTATHNDTTNVVGVVSSAFLLAGKYYFEATIQVSTTTSNNIGLMVSTGVPGDIRTGLNGVAIIFGPASTFVYVNSVQNSAANLGATAVGDVFSVAVDFTNRLFWGRRNAGNWNADAAADPATGVNGIAFGVAGGAYAPGVGFTGAGATDKMTMNFGATSYVRTPPSGFANWIAGWTPFKLTTTLSSPQPGQAGYIHARVRAAKPSTTYYIDPTVTLS